MANAAMRSTLPLFCVVCRMAFHILDGFPEAIVVMVTDDAIA